MGGRSDSCGCRGCCIFPNGKLGILALFLAIFGFFFGIGGNRSCRFMRVDNPSGTEESSLPQFESLGFGLWSRQDEGNKWSCVDWTQEDIDNLFDGPWRGARALGFLANAMGGICLVIIICLSCTSAPVIFLKGLSYTYVLAGLFEILTFIAFGSDICMEFDCSWNWGAGFAIGSSIVYVLNAFVVSRIPMYTVEEEPETERVTIAVPMAAIPPPGSVSQTQSVLPDGTQRTVRTTVNADGTQTVEESVEKPPIIPIAEARLIED